MEKIFFFYLTRPISRYTALLIRYPHKRLPPLEKKKVPVPLIMKCKTRDGFDQQTEMGEVQIECLHGSLSNCSS